MKKTISVLIALISITVYGQQLTKITAAADPWPPFIDPNNKTQGLSLEIVRAAFETQGIKVDMSIIPWARAEESVKDGSIDILPNMWFTKEREKSFLYGEPYATNEVKFIKRKGDNFEYNGINSLSGKKVGTVIGYGYGDDFLSASSFSKDPASDSMTNIKKLVANRIDLTLEDKIVMTSVLQKNAPELLKEIEFSANSLSSNKLHIATGKANKNAKAIIDAYNKGLQEIKKNGKFDEILKKYGL